MGVERGCLVLADIGGYTSYLTGVELEHSHDVLADLLDTVVGTAGGGVRRVEQSNPGGLPGVGTTNHCVHGPAQEEILDWKPFSYFTFTSADPGGRFLFTCELVPVGDERTLVSWRAVPQSRRARLLARPIRPVMAKTLREGMATIERLAAEERSGSGAGAVR